MKKIIVFIGILATLTACSSTTKNNTSLEEKYKVDTVAMKNWEETFSKVITGEAELEDWYGADQPVSFLARNQKLDQKQVKFLDSLKTKGEITEADQDQFNAILEKTVKKLPRQYYLKDENIKDPAGLAKYMVAQSYIRMENPSNHIANQVATKEEWAEIVAYSKKSDLTEKEIKKFRKTLNKFIKRGEFFDSKTWYFVEVSPRIIEVNNMYKKVDKTKLEKNNVNAKSLYLAYSQYFSKLEKWDD
ncbi:MAG: membrane lipoprotein lipid attachment site-containing protein [Cetobacterium sp.]